MPAFCAIWLGGLKFFADIGILKIKTENAVITEQVRPHLWEVKQLMFQVEASVSFLFKVRLIGHTIVK